MGLIRFIMFALVIWVMWAMIRNYQAAKRRSEPVKKLSRGRMVKCEYCSLHVPEEAAVSYDNLWFCNHNHKAKFLAGGGK